MITAGGYNFGTMKLFGLNLTIMSFEKFPMLYESVNTTTVIIEASNYYNVYIFGTRSTQDQVRAAGGKRVGIKTSHSRSLLTFKIQEIVLKVKLVRMVRPDVMSRGGSLVHSPTARVARLEKV